MPQEIERKFLVADSSWRGQADAGRRLRQAYLAETDKLVVRARVVDGGEALLTIKSAESGLSRQEYEYSIPLVDGEALMALRQGSVLEKTRYHVTHAGRGWEVDVYHGENAGLVLAEIEIESEAATVDQPPWLGREVTGDARYYAARLAQHPFGAWQTDDASGERGQ
jgi:adenylate cyclase